MRAEPFVCTRFLKEAGLFICLGGLFATSATGQELPRTADVLALAHTEYGKLQTFIGTVQYEMLESRGGDQVTTGTERAEVRISGARMLFSGRLESFSGEGQITYYTDSFDGQYWTRWSGQEDSPPTLVTLDEGFLDGRGVRLHPGRWMGHLNSERFGWTGVLSRNLDAADVVRYEDYGGDRCLILRVPWEIGGDTVTLDAWLAESKSMLPVRILVTHPSGLNGEITFQYENREGIWVLKSGFSAIPPPETSEDYSVVRYTLEPGYKVNPSVDPGTMAPTFKVGTRMMDTVHNELLIWNGDSFEKVADLEAPDGEPPVRRIKKR